MGGGESIIQRGRVALQMAGDLPDGMAEALREAFFEYRQELGDGSSVQSAKQALAEELLEIFSEWGF